jgi:hypothetical protein
MKMTKTYTVTISTSGDGSETKAEELIAKVVAKIEEIHASLGNIQLDLTIEEVE